MANEKEKIFILMFLIFLTNYPIALHFIFGLPQMTNLAQI